VLESLEGLNKGMVCIDCKNIGLDGRLTEIKQTHFKQLYQLIPKLQTSWNAEHIAQTSDDESN
jgi:hypothetical protein